MNKLKDLVYIKGNVPKILTDALVSCILIMLFFDGLFSLLWQFQPKLRDNIVQNGTTFYLIEAF